MNDTLDRLPYGFYEGDQDGYLYTPDDGDTEDHAPGVGLAVYIDSPDQQLATFEPALNEGFEFTEDELAAWPDWMGKEYPSAEIVNDGADVLTLEWYGTYQDGEDTERLLGRITDNPDYVRLRNRWTIFYHGLEDYIVHCKVQRDQED